MKSLKPYRVPLAMITAAVVVLGGAFVAFSWAPWEKPSTRELELEWLARQASWLAGLEGELAAGERPGPADCRASLSGVVGPPPSPRLRSAARLVSDACAQATPERWSQLGRTLESHLVLERFGYSKTTHAPALARAAGEIARRPVRVHCWRAGGWTLLVEELVAIGSFEAALGGYADTGRGRVHLSPFVCGPLRRFFTGPFTPFGNRESFDLASSLKVLAHEAEHIADPAAPEPTVECFAIQHVRELVLDRGRKPAYAHELAGLAELARDDNPPELKSPDCRNGGPLDRNPASSAWP